MHFLVWIAGRGRPRGLNVFTESLLKVQRWGSEGADFPSDCPMIWRHTERSMCWTLLGPAVHSVCLIYVCRWTLNDSGIFSILWTRKYYLKCLEVSTKRLFLFLFHVGTQICECRPVIAVESVFNIFFFIQACRKHLTVTQAEKRTWNENQQLICSHGGLAVICL